MREALALVAEEGLEASWARHKQLHLDLWDGLGKLGLEPFVENPEERLVTVNTIKVGRGQIGFRVKAFVENPEERLVTVNAVKMGLRLENGVTQGRVVCKRAQG